MTARRLRLVPALVLALLFAALAGTARAETFGVVQTVRPSLPPAGVPNLPGTIALPAAFTSAPPVPETRSLQQLEALWQQAGQTYGIPWQVLGAINKVESNFGRNMGPSSAGAVGWMQFMPSTWESWGTDANGDGVADPWNPEDAVYSSARYLAAAGGATDIRRAIFAYNHADWYVNEVLGVAALFGTGGIAPFDAAAASTTASSVATLDQLQGALDAARKQVVVTNAQVIAAEKVQRRLDEATRRWTARAAASKLLSDQLAAQKQATLAGIRADRAAAEVTRLRGELGTAEQSLSTARDQARTASFAPVAGTMLGAPSYSAGGYVFPVGGGPSQVSAGHTHHDYPAVDIAAPEGSPLYALSNGVIVRSWASPDPRCGIGLTMQTQDGLVWTYCHMSYLEPSIQPGVAVTAGQPVGLVGSTGHASGPHLHLQLQPPTQWPQRMAWFESFAGTAFRWQDAAPNAAVAAADAAALNGESRQPMAVSAAAAPVATAPAVPATRPIFQVVQPAPAPAAKPTVIQFTHY